MRRSAMPSADRFATDDYRELESPAGWYRWRPWAICRWNLALIFRRKLFWALLSLGLLHFLLFFVLIYMKAQLTVQNPGMATFLERFLVTGTGEAYRDFLNGQARAVMILLAYAGIVLICADFQRGGLAFYLSRPIGKFQYLLGKGLALWLIIGLLTIVPGFTLFFAYGVFSNSSEYWLDNPSIVVGIAGYSVVVMTTLSLLTMAVAAACKTSTAFALSWTSIFLLLQLVSELLRHVFDSHHWRLLNLWRSIRIMGDLCFGTVSFEGEWGHVHYSAIIVACVCVACLVILLWKVRPIEIVG